MEFDVSRVYVPEPRRTRARGGGGIFAAALVLYVVLAVVLSATLGAASSVAAYELWTNVFFAWPIVRALTLPRPAYVEAAVFASTLVVSALHHTCGDGALLGQLFALLAVAAALVGVALVVVVARRSAVLAVAAALVTLAVVIVSIVYGALGGGSCAGSPAALGQVDMVLAAASVVIVLVYVVQVPPAVGFAGFWLLIFVAMLALVGYANALSDSAALGIVAATGGTLLLLRLLSCAAYEDGAELLAHYDWYDVAAMVALGAAALLLFFVANSPTLHGVWHILGALALYFALETLYRPVSLVGFELYAEPT